MVESVGTTGFLQLEGDSFNKLTPREQTLAYWLSQASIAIDPIIYDQLSRYGLREKRLLEALVAHPQGAKPEVMAKIVAFTKLFWGNKGNHNETTAQKFLPECCFHFHTRSTNFSRPISRRFCCRSINCRSTIICVAMPA